MPLIKNGVEVDDIWAFVPDEADLEPGGCFTVSLHRYLNSVDSLRARNDCVGVRLVPEDEPSLLADHLDHVRLVEISFPKYTDGRGYSQAQLLRRRYGFEGEIRAVGHVLRDQILYMHRSGFNAYETARADLSSVLEALTEYSHYYQPAAGTAETVFAMRRAKG